MPGARVESLGREDPLEWEMAPHSRILAWKIPWTEEHGGLQSMGSQRVGHFWVTNNSDTSEWLTIDLQGCVNFCCRAKWFSYICIFFFFILLSIIVYLRILNIASWFLLQRVYSSLPIWEAWFQQQWGRGLLALRDLGSNYSGSTNWSWARRLNSSLFHFFCQPVI